MILPSVNPEDYAGDIVLRGKRTRRRAVPGDLCYAQLCMGYILPIVVTRCEADPDGWGVFFNLVELYRPVPSSVPTLHDVSPDNIIWFPEVVSPSAWFGGFCRFANTAGEKIDVSDRSYVFYRGKDGHLVDDCGRITNAGFCSGRASFLPAPAFCGLAGYVSLLSLQVLDLPFDISLLPPVRTAPNPSD